MNYEAKVTVRTTTEYKMVFSGSFESLSTLALASAKPENLEKSITTFEILVLPIPAVSLPKL